MKRERARANENGLSAGKVRLPGMQAIGDVAARLNAAIAGRVTRRISPRTWLAFGLTSIVCSTLMMSLMLGLIPDSQNLKREGRTHVSEAIAINASVLVARSGVEHLTEVLTAIHHRNEDLLSVGMRRADGQLVTEIGDHREHWQELPEDRSSGSQVAVPLHQAGQRWGTVELRFEPDGYLDALGLRSMALVALVGGCCFLAFRLYLRRVLQQLDPSRAVPSRVRSALDTLTEGLLILDRKQRIVLANHAFAQLMGIPPEKLVGRDAGQFGWRMEGNETGAVQHPWTRALQEECPQPNVLMHLRVQDRDATFIVNCSPVLGHDGNYRGVLASFDDVTQLEEKKVELRKSMEAAEEASRSKSQFLANMSHEIRTPMNAILGFTDVLRRGMAVDPQQQRQHLDTIYRSGNHLLELINDILDLSKIESGRLQVERIDCPIHELVHEVTSVLSVKAQEQNLTLGAEFLTEIPVRITSDPTRVRQILTNVIGNAIKFTERGGVRLLVALEAENGGWMRVDVVDTGIGMTPEQQAKIFEAFVQADSSTTRRFGGTGLGLSISRHFAEALGGSLEVASTYGVGTTFTLKLPTGDLSGVEMISPERAWSLAREAAGGGGEVIHLPRVPVLVVDDGAPNRQLLELVLGRAGAEVHLATNGREALEQVAAGVPFQLILMDMQMPVMDGYTAVAHLRKAKLKTPIVALTGNAMKGDREKCLAAGCDDFLSKPVSIDSLLECAARYLGTAPPGPSGKKNASSQNAAGGDTAGPPIAIRPAADKPVAPAGSGAVGDAAGAVYCSLPMEDSAFREIATRFVDRLEEQTRAMQAALQSEDWPELAALAHRLKGAGGTVGFAAFTEPSRRLETAAKEGDPAAARAALEEILQLADRIVVPQL